MDAYLLDWLNFLLRWAHVLVAIAWIGASFYFVFLDSNLLKPTAPDLVGKGVDGELWAVHGGGFYNAQKYMVAPRGMPEHLHWFYWEAYSTWLTGFSLFVAVYLFQPTAFLIDPRVHSWEPSAAIMAAIAFLVIFWVLYDNLCRLFEKRGGPVLSVLVGLVLVGASWLSCHLFSGRAAFVLIGAMMGTSMSANVFFWIIPGQRTVIAQMKAGKPVEAIHGQRAKQRSVHNTYFTLPVLVAMLSNHYGFLNSAQGNWMVLVALMCAGALIRHSFVARHKANVLGKRVPWEYAVAGVAILAGVGVALAPAPQPPAAADGGPAAAAPAPVVAATFANVRSIVDARCKLCHNAQFANKGVQLDIAAGILKNAPLVYQQAVVLKAMPLNNATQITDAERDVIKRWYEAGAHPQ